jgi:hypothetical protein
VPRSPASHSRPTALRRLVSVYLLVLQACARGELELHRSARGDDVGVFACPAWTVRAGGTPDGAAVRGGVPHAGATLLSCVCRRAGRAASRPHAPAGRGPLALLIAGCARRALVLCHGRGRDCVAARRAAGRRRARRGCELLAQYCSERAAWRCPARSVLWVNAPLSRVRMGLRQLGQELAHARLQLWFRKRAPVVLAVSNSAVSDRRRHDCVAAVRGIPQ